MAKKTPKEFKPGQLIRIKLSNGRIEEARVNHVIQHADGTKLQVDFGHDETALIGQSDPFNPPTRNEMWQRRRRTENYASAKLNEKTRPLPLAGDGVDAWSLVSPFVSEQIL